LYENFRNSPVYARIWEEINKHSMDSAMRFENDDQRRQYVMDQADKVFTEAQNRDVRRHAGGTDSPPPMVETPDRPITDVQQTGQAELVPPEQLDPRAAPAFASAEEREAIPLIQAELKKHKPGSEAHKILSDQLARAQMIAGGQMPPQTPTTWSGPKSPQPGLVTPAELEGEKQTAKNYADQHQADLASIAGIRNMGPALETMKAILSNPNLINVGPLHEQLTELGGFMAYIDPSSDLAKSVNNTPAYFSNLMNLVRDKIAALGSGTAVSNLDLIVTQKSVGDLRNTPEGNRKLIAIMELQNATMLDRLNKKVKYYDSGRQGYKGWNEESSKLEPLTHAIRRDNGTKEYRIQSKEDWISELRRLNPNWKGDVNAEWAKFANQSLATLIGDGIQHNGITIKLKEKK
jgi:hypothetical protein